MKKRIGIALLLIITLLFSLLAFMSCSDDGDDSVLKNGDKQVPVYQGMSITSAKTAKTLSYNTAPDPNTPPDPC